MCAGLIVDIGFVLPCTYYAALPTLKLGKPFHTFIVHIIDVTVMYIVN